MKDLIKQATEIGFEAKLPEIYENPGTFRVGMKPTKLSAYLWLCELQKWLIDEKRILVEISYNFMDDDLGYGANVMTNIDNIETLRWLGLDITGTWYKTYKIALSKGLSEALNLIKK